MVARLRATAESERARQARAALFAASSRRVTSTIPAGTASRSENPDPLALHHLGPDQMHLKKGGGRNHLIAAFGGDVHTGTPAAVTHFRTTCRSWHGVNDRLVWSAHRPRRSPSRHRRALLAGRRLRPTRRLPGTVPTIARYRNLVHRPALSSYRRGLTASDPMSDASAATRDDTSRSHSCLTIVTAGVTLHDL
jgi:hypothetical protein